jgi:hypothetical protein
MMVCKLVIFHEVCCKVLYWIAAGRQFLDSCLIELKALLDTKTTILLVHDVKMQL